MDFQDLLQGRHSIRSFSNREVTEEQLVQMVKDAQTTASWVNSQPWKVYAATGQTLATVKDDHQKRLAVGEQSRPVLPVLSRSGWQADQQANMAAWSEHLEQETTFSADDFWQLNQELFKAPAVLYLALPKSSPAWSVLDLGAFLQTLTLSALNQGLGTMVAYELIKFPDVLADVLGVDEQDDVAIALAVGYPDHHPVNHFRSPRRPLDDILTIKT